jgi:uncharacterized protein YkwD
MLLLFPLRAPASTIRAVNRARAADCDFPRPPPPLVASRELDEVARRLAQGFSLEQAQRRAGYVAARSLWIRITGATDDTAVRRMIGRQFCGQLGSPHLRAIGVYHRRDAVWIVVAQPLTTPSVQDAAAVSRRVLALTNQARAQARHCGARGFPPAPALTLSAALTRAARAHAQDMAAHRIFSHTGSDGSTPGTRVSRAGYRWSMVGENIASGVGTARAVVAGWLASPHHCANIMTAGYRQMGVAFAISPANPQYIDWTEDFGTRLSRGRPPRGAAARARAPPR